MLGRRYDDQVCSAARALEVVGERWTLLIVRDVLLGTVRFDGLLASLGIARNVLSDRLTGLVEHGVLERVAYQQHPPRYEYRPTAAGRELAVVVIALMQWGDRNVPSPDGPPRTALHAPCEGELVACLTCPDCGEPAGPGEVGMRWNRA
ncbi:winged helix-turn-helix transcriptional regulator [Lentzea sp. JNUCC 0626]|uniref:winged helix-turn-helix transcriptional regulator n=1 Tax=Lentzea sp. JNUCC 0626 TaxID=3367513 RepID=UPI003748F26C